MHQSRLGQAVEAVREAIAAFDQVPLSATARRALRIARLTGDWQAVWWLEMESLDLSKRDSLNRKAEMANYFPSDELERIHEVVVTEYMHERRNEVPGDDQGQNKVMAMSIEQIEARRDLLDRERAAAAPPTGMHTLDLYYAQQRYDATRAAVDAATTVIDTVMSRVRRRIWDYLVRTDVVLAFGNAQTELFEVYRTIVDQGIRDIAPEVLEQFVAAYDRLGDGTTESRSHAVLSCRRLLKSLADRLYPPSDESVVGSDGNARPMTEDRYIARLWQFTHVTAANAASSRYRTLLGTNVQELGARLDALYDLLSTGVHADLADFEVRSAVIQTYLLTADFLIVADRSASDDSVPATT